MLIVVVVLTTFLIWFAFQLEHRVDHPILYANLAFWFLFLALFNLPLFSYLGREEKYREEGREWDLLCGWKNCVWVIDCCTQGCSRGSGSSLILMVKISMVFDFEFCLMYFHCMNLISSTVWTPILLPWLQCLVTLLLVILLNRLCSCWSILI